MYSVRRPEGTPSIVVQGSWKLISIHFPYISYSLDPQPEDMQFINALFSDILEIPCLYIAPKQYLKFNRTKGVSFSIYKDGDEDILATGGQPSIFCAERRKHVYSSVC